MEERSVLVLVREFGEAMRKQGELSERAASWEGTDEAREVRFCRLRAAVFERRAARLLARIRDLMVGGW